MNKGLISVLRRPRSACAGRADVLVRIALALALALPLPLAQQAHSRSIFDEIAEAIEEHNKKLAEEQVEDQVEENVEEAVEEEVEEAIEEEVAETVDDEVEDQVEEDIAENVEESVEDAVEDSVTEQVEERIAEAVTEDVEEMIASTVEESIEESVAASVEESIDESVETFAEQTVEDSVEESVESAVEDSVDDAVELFAEEAVEDNVEDNIMESVIDSIIETTEQQLEARIDTPERHLSKQEWLVMAEEGALQALADSGYVFDRVTRLDGLGLQLAEVSAPASFDISEVRAGILDVVGGDLAEVDVNHLYTAGAPTPENNDGLSPADAMPFPADTLSLPLRIGMIDTAVDTGHAAFDGSRLQVRHFGSDGASAPDFHGTAIASMLSAASSSYSGIAPGSRLYAASVFEEDRERGQVASTASLVKALDWLAKEQVEVVNISLAGPPNRLLEAVLGRVVERGVPVLAAAGNAGPASGPLYPAAYDSVVAITAVETSGRVFRLANRGEHLDLSAPGVNIRHAVAGGGYQASSGTSFAVPFATVAVARLLAQDSAGDALASLYQSALDLGPPGKDSIYGYGLLNPVPPRQVAVAAR